MSVSFNLVGPRWAANAPLWTATIEVEEGEQRRAARLIFSERNNHALGQDRPANMPGTLLIHARIKAVCVKLGNSAVTDGLDNVFFDASSAVEETFLVTADPDHWKLANGINEVRIASMVCIAGDFPLSPFFGSNLEKLPARFKQKLSMVCPQGIENLRASSFGLHL